MSSISKVMVCAALACAMVVAVPGVLQAQSIGIHFPSDRDNARLQPDEVAGVVPQANWNSADGGTDNDGVEGPSNRMGNTDSISLPNVGVLTDDSGALLAGVTVEWISNGTWNTTNGMDTADAKLMNGYIDAYSNDAVPEAPGVTVSFTGIPYALYDAIVYLGSDGNDRQGQVTDGTTTYYYLTQSNDPGGDGGFDPSTDYIQAIATDPADRAPGNYAVFSGLTDPTLDVSIIDWSSGNNNGIHAVQLVYIPEPASIALLSTGLMGLLIGVVALRRRKRT